MFDDNRKVKAYTFVNKKSRLTNFIYNDDIQYEYLEICLEGACRFGEEFYEMFIETTSIDGESIKNIGALSDLIMKYR